MSHVSLLDIVLPRMLCYLQLMFIGLPVNNRNIHLMQMKANLCKRMRVTSQMSPDVAEGER